MATSTQAQTQVSFECDVVDFSDTKETDPEAKKKGLGYYLQTLRSMYSKELVTDEQMEVLKQDLRILFPTLFPVSCSITVRNMWFRDPTFEAALKQLYPGFEKPHDFRSPGGAVCRAIVVDGTPVGFLWAQENKFMWLVKKPDISFCFVAI